MRKIFTLLLVASLFAFFAGRAVVVAKEKAEIPEVDGVYNDPEHPGVKVRVFVHKERPERTRTAVLVCSPDPGSDSVVPAAGWHLPSNWKYNLNISSVPSSVDSFNLPTFAGEGFTDWSNATGNKVTLAKGADTTTNRQAYDLQNVVAWGRTQGTALAVTYIRYYPDTGLVVDVDTIMNKKFAWSYSGSTACADSNSYDAWDILKHEQGHWMGLDDTYTAAYVNNTMFGYGSKGEVKKTTLTNGDKAGVAAVYSSF